MKSPHPATPAVICKSPRWALYEELCSRIPDDLQVEGVLVGQHWTLVKSAIGVGIAMTPPESRLHSMPDLDRYIGTKIGNMAELSKSWNPLDAALGVAAMNAYFNTPPTIRRHWRVAPGKQKNESVFIAMKNEVAGSKVAVIGHFPDLDELARVCLLSILERNPRQGDYPDPACEYILHDQKYLFMTGVTLTNKTLPRLLELGSASRMVLVGPSAPLAPLWFEKGLFMLAGTIVTDAGELWKHVALGGDRSIFRHGARTIKLKVEDIR